MVPVQITAMLQNDVGLLLVFPISFVVHATCVPSSKVFAKVPELVHVFITLKVRNYNDCY